MRYLLSMILLSGCTLQTGVVPVDDHFACMVMCESTREKFQNTKLAGVQHKVEEYCYKQCNASFSGKNCSQSTYSSQPNAQEFIEKMKKKKPRS